MVTFTHDFLPSLRGACAPWQSHTNATARQCEGIVTKQAQATATASHCEARVRRGNPIDIDAL